jgi:hypothetical protein
MERLASNPYRQWLEGDPISKKPKDMTNEELVKFTAAGAVVIVQRLKSLEPYLRELRRRFHKLKPGEKICGFRNWGEYCTKHLHKTKRALNYMLSGGNKNRVEVLPKQNLLPPNCGIGLGGKLFPILLLLPLEHQLSERNSDDKG